MDAIKFYEVETRVWFHDREEAFEKLPFLNSFLENKVQWETKTYGFELFRQGKLLRSSVSRSMGRTYFSLGYKDIDEGTFCNMRREWDEDIAEPVMDSKVLKLVTGLPWEEVLRKQVPHEQHDNAHGPLGGRMIHSDNVEEVLRSLGQEEFMVFQGNSLFGRMEDISVKLMHCEALQYPWLVELEKSAADLQEAGTKEQELKEWVHTYHLSDRVIRKEPPTLLYDALFSQGQIKSRQA